jgi:hypothetical protein
MTAAVIEPEGRISEVTIEGLVRGSWFLVHANASVIEYRYATRWDNLECACSLGLVFYRPL